MAIELTRVKSLKCTGKSGIWRLGGYEDRYPGTWREEVEAQLAKGTAASAGYPAQVAIVCVTKV